MRKIELKNEKIKEVFNQKETVRNRINELNEKINGFKKEINELNNKINNLNNNYGVYTRELMRIAREGVEVAEDEYINAIKKGENEELYLEIKNADDLIDTNRENAIKQIKNIKEQDEEILKEVGEIVDEDNLEVK